MNVRPRKTRAAGRVSAALLLLSLALLGGCDPPPAAVLATVTEVSPDAIEPGDVIRITGTGFVEGSARVTLRGEFDPEGLAEAREREVALDGTAISGTAIEVPITSVLMERLALEPVEFRGTLAVSFPTALPLGAVRIAAESPPQEISLRPAGAGVAHAAKRGRDAREFLDRLGMGMGNAARKDDLLVDDVEAGSPADRAGIEPGDRLLALDGTALAARTDLSGIEARASYEFQIVSPRGTVRDVAVLATPDDRLDLDEFVAVLLTSVALGLFLAFVAPTRRRFDGPTEDADNPIPRILGSAVVSVPMLLVPSFVIFGTADLLATLALLGFGVAGVAGVAIYGRGKLVARLLGFLAYLLPLPVMLVLAGALGTTIGLAEVIGGQEATPWGWYVWANPFTLIAVVAAISLLWTAPADGSGPIARLAGWSAATAGAMLIAACGLGGWLIPGVPLANLAGDPALLLTGTLLFTAKTWLVLLAARWFASAGVRDRRGSRRRSAPQVLLRALTLLLAAAAALAWEWSAIPEDLVAAGQLLASGAFVALAVAFVVRSIYGLLPRRRAAIWREADGVPSRRA